MSKNTSASMAASPAYVRRSVVEKKGREGRRGAIVAPIDMEETRSAAFVDIESGLQGGNDDTSYSSAESSESVEKYSDTLINNLENIKSLLKYGGFATATASTGFKGDSERADNAFYLTFAIASMYMIADLGQKYCISKNLGNQSSDYHLFEDWKSFGLSTLSGIAGSIVAGTLKDKGQDFNMGIGVFSAVTTSIYDIVSNTLEKAINVKSQEEIEHGAVDHAILQARHGVRNAVYEYSDKKAILGELDQLRKDKRELMLDLENARMLNTELEERLKGMNTAPAHQDIELSNEESPAREQSFASIDIGSISSVNSSGGSFVQKVSDSNKGGRSVTR